MSSYISPGKCWARPGRRRASRQVPSVLGGGGRRLRGAAEDTEDSKPAGHGLGGPVPLPALCDHFHHRHDVRVGEGRVKVQGLQNRNQNADEGHGAPRPESRKQTGTQPPGSRHRHPRAERSVLSNAPEVTRGAVKRPPPSRSSSPQSADRPGHRAGRFCPRDVPSTTTRADAGPLGEGLEQHAPRPPPSRTPAK